MCERGKRKFFNGLLVFAASWFAVVFLYADRTENADALEPFVRSFHGLGMGPFCTLILGALFFYRLSKIREKRQIRFAAAGGALFTICMFFGFNISCWGSVFRIHGGLLSGILDISWTIGCFLTLSGLLLLLFHLIEEHPIKPEANRFLDTWLGCSRRSFFACFAVLMLIYTALMIFYYPGVVTQDSNRQIAESLGMLPLADAHPYVHTLILSISTHIGTALFGNIAAGVAIHTMVQASLIAALVSYLLMCMAEKKIHPCFRVLTFAFFSLHPVVAVHSVTVWKDIWIAYFLLLYTFLLTEIALNADDFFRVGKNRILLVISILGFLFTKNTGIIVLIGTLPFLFISARKYWKQIAVTAVICFSAVAVSRLIVMPALHVIPGDAAAPLSVPLQQIARVCTLDGDSLTEEQKEIMSEILPLEDLPKVYDPVLSDEVKGRLNEDAFRKNTGRYVKCWLEIGKSHKRIYLESLLANSYGYWYPEVLYTQLVENSYFTGGLVDGSRPYQDPNAGNYRFTGASPAVRHYIVYLFEAARQLPGLMVLLSVAFYFWGSALLALIAVLKRKYRLLLPLAVPLMVFITCIMSPVVAECRYAFPALIILPVLTPYVLQDVS